MYLARHELSVISKLGASAVTVYIASASPRYQTKISTFFLVLERNKIAVSVLKLDL